ncbi:hypothetical protein ACS91J_04585 [Pectobacterium carotovorum]
MDKQKKERWVRRNKTVSELRKDPVAGKKIKERDRVLYKKKRDKNKDKINALAREKYKSDPEIVKKKRESRKKRIAAMSPEEKANYLEKKRSADREARARRVERLKADPVAWREFQLKQRQYKAEQELRKAQANLFKIKG